MRKGVLVLLLVCAVLPLGAQSPSASDLAAVYQIKDEGFNHSQVMEIMSYLTDVYGPRLTNSPNIKQAAECVGFGGGLPNQGRGIQSFPGDGDHELSHGRLRPTPDEFAKH